MVKRSKKLYNKSMKIVKEYLEYLGGVLKSRTVWTCIAMIIINGVPSIQGFIPVEHQDFVNQALAAMAIFFRVNAKQNL